MKNFDKKLELLLNEINHNNTLFDFFSSKISLQSEETKIISTSSYFNIFSLNDEKTFSLINLKKINDLRYINKFFDSINSVIPINGLFIGCVETYPNRRLAIYKQYPFILNRFIYAFDMIFKRVFPKLFITRKLYYYLTKGKNRVISRAETYGRLYASGFQIVDELSINNIQYFLAKKVGTPIINKNTYYGPIIKLKRYGKSKKIFNVYKLRTMHPYSEYLQDYIYQKNQLAKGGKIMDDFRISPEGRFFRKFWIDEMPMIYNLLRGELKLVGVRPLSKHYFNLYTKELQEKRVKFKPGLIPPFYVDMPETLNQIMQSELKYLKQYEKSPFKTDLYYLIMSLKNIIFKKARSQ